MSEILRVSEITIRRDLTCLEQQGAVGRTHGGAIYRQELLNTQFQYKVNAGRQKKEKQRIAQRVAEMIVPEDIVFLGEGTTPAMVISYVDPGLHFTLYTNNMGVLPEVEDKSVELILLGGAYNSTTLSSTGPIVLEIIRHVHAKKVILGADAINISAGLTTANPEVAVINRTMIQHTHGEIILLADHTKFGLVAGMTIMPLNNADVIVTDQEISDDVRGDLQAMGIRVEVA